MSSAPALPEIEVGAATDARIRARRRPKSAVDPWRPLDVTVEAERVAGGGRATTVTVFLAGSECPFTCVFCDLWHATLDDPTPEGAIPAQIERALAAADVGPETARIKLYNASNFFDSRAVPVADHGAIAALVGAFERVIVECHPRLVGDVCLPFAERLGGTLEVAMGLETVHPGALPRLNKRMTRHDYDRAAGFLAAHGLVHRSFVLVGAPFVPPERAVDWAVISAAYALDRGAETVTLIPVRGGELGALADGGWFRPPRLADLETALDRALELRGAGVVQADLWDLERLAECSECLARRRDRLERINLSGRPAARIECEVCGGASR